MELFKLDDAVANIYNVICTPSKCIHVFSSNTAQSLSDIIESIRNNEESQDGYDSFNYTLVYSGVPIGDRYRDYALNILRNNFLNMNDKIFQIYLYPFYLETFVNSGFAVLSTDGTISMAECVHSTLELGHNQYVNNYALRNGAETMEDQSAFILKQVKIAVDTNYKFIKDLEDLNFNDLDAEFIGWMDAFPSNLLEYILSLDNFNSTSLKIDKIEKIEIIEQNILDIVSTCSMFTVELKRV